MKKRTPEEVSAIVKKHSKQYGIEQSSYEVQAQDGKPQGWIAQVRLWNDLGDRTVVTTVYETKSDWRFASKEDADNWALWMAADWLEEHT